MLNSIKPIAGLKPSSTTPPDLALLIGTGDPVSKCYDNGSDVVALTDSRLVIAQSHRGKRSVTSIPFTSLLTVTMRLDKRGKHEAIAFTDLSGGVLETAFSEASDRQDIYYLVYDGLTAR